MAEPLLLVQQARNRIVRQKQLNAAGVFIPLACSSWILGRFLFDIFLFPRTVLFLFPFLCCGFLWAALRKARATVDATTTAALLDGKLKGQDRFLTLATASSQTTEASFYPIVQHQAEQLSDSFRLKRDFPFAIERRAILAGCCVLLSVLLWLSRPYLIPTQSTLSSLLHTEPESIFYENEITALEKIARRLLQPVTTQQEQRIGSQLLTLTQQLQDPALSSQEKQQLIEETQKRIKLDLPFPQILPFDLKIFASNSKEGQGERNEEDTTQNSKGQSADTDPSNGSSQQSTSATAPGNDAQQETKSDAEKKKQSQPQNGGGVTFNFPQPQTQNQKHASPEQSGAGQQPSQDQPQQGLAPGTDPNRLGGNQNNQSQDQKSQQGGSEQKGKEQNAGGEAGGKIGQGKGERFLKPGEKAGGGFLTEDARFVKVRVPMAQEAQEGGGKYTENKSRAEPKTPYSNAPLKEATPEQTQARQRIPLEYRSIFKD